MKCSWCGKEGIKFGIYTINAPSELWYGFCSKVCIANATIKSRKIMRLKCVK